MIRAALLVFIAAIIGGCYSVDSDNAELAGTHPADDYYDRQQDVKHLDYERQRSSQDIEWNTFGSHDGSRQNILGRVSDIEYYNTEIYVLDSGYNRVRAFDTSAAQVHIYGRRGAGPHEISSPTSMSIGEDGTLAILDRSRAVKIFKLGSDSLLTVNTFKLSKAANDICITNRRIYVQVPVTADDKGASIVEYNINGDRLSMFGDLYETGSLLITRQVSEASLFCNYKRGIVGKIGDNIEHIRIYNDQGENVRTVKLERLDLPEMKARVDGRGKIAIREAELSNQHQYLTDIYYHSNNIYVSTVDINKEAIDNKNIEQLSHYVYEVSYPITNAKRYKFDRSSRKYGDMIVSHQRAPYPQIFISK